MYQAVDKERVREKLIGISLVFLSYKGAQERAEFMKESSFMQFFFFMILQLGYSFLLVLNEN